MARILQVLAVNSIGSVRRERMGGRSYLVVPFTSLGPRVLPGSKGLLYYPRKQVEANPGVWNGVPITAGHPSDPVTNEPLSASYGPDHGKVRRRFQLGVIKNDRSEGGWRKGEAWYDEELTKNRSPETYQKLIANEPFDLSTGLYTDNDFAPGVTLEGQSYEYIARNYRPDHLAALPNQRGACSVSEGCGMNVNAVPTNNPFVSEEQRRACYAADDPNWDCDEWNDSTPKNIPKVARNEMVMNKSFWHRLGEAFGMTFSSATTNYTTPNEIGGGGQPRHLESGQFIPTGSNRGEKQFQTSAERGFSHLLGETMAPKEDVDDDGVPNEHGAFTGQGDRGYPDEDHGLHIPGRKTTGERVKNDAGGSESAGIKVDGQPMRGSRSAQLEEDAQASMARNDGKCPECGGQMIHGRCKCGYSLEDNAAFTVPPPMAPAAEGGTGMSGSPMHVGPTGGTTSNAATCPKCGDDMMVRGRQLVCNCGYTMSATKNADMSHDDLRGKLQGQLDKKQTHDKPKPSIHHVDDDHVVYHDGDGFKKQQHDNGDLTGPPVPVKPVTTFQPATTNEGPMTLTNEARRRAVGWLTANCACQKGKDKVLLNRENYTDDEIIAMVKNAEKDKKNATMVANARAAGIQLNEKAQSSSADQTADTQVDANDSKLRHTEDDEEAQYKNHQVKGPASLNAFKDMFKTVFGMTVEDAQQVLNLGNGHTKDRKQQLIALLTQNQRNPQARAIATATLNKLSIQELEAFAAGLPPMMQPMINAHMMGVQTGAPVQPVFGPELDEEVLNGTPATNEQQRGDGPDTLPFQTWNTYKREALENQNRQRA